MDPIVEARKLRRENWSIDGKISLPIDPFEIAKSIGIEIRKTPLKDPLSGFILKEEGESPVITVNSRDHIHRQRFTVAHELGHFVRRRGDETLGYVDNRDELSSTGRDPDERWSNSFAAELLMPAKGVLARWADGDPVDDIARVYRVSPAAMQNRLNNLGLV